MPRTAICREGWHYLLLLAAVLVWAMLMEANLLFIVVGMLCGPLLVNWRMASVMIRQVEVRRRMAQVVFAGEPLAIDVELRNNRKRLGSWALVVENHVRREDDRNKKRSISPKLLFPYLPAGQSRRRVCRICLPQRGRYRLGPLTLSTRFPFGLFRRKVTVKGSRTLTVFPRLGQLTPAWNRRQAAALQGSYRGRQPTRAPGEFFGVREWQLGDSMRWVHWRSSARHGELVTRQFERPSGRDVAVLLDLWQPDKPGLEERENVELAVSFAATVVADLCNKGGSKVLLGVAGAEECLSGPTSVSLKDEALRRLAVAQASSKDRLAELLETASRWIGSDTEVILVSTRSQDLADHRRFAAFSADARPVPGDRVSWINTTDPDFNSYFQIDRQFAE